MFIKNIANIGEKSIIPWYPILEIIFLAGANMGSVTE